jgi:hypothetical protein
MEWEAKKVSAMLGRGIWIKIHLNPNLSISVR